MRYTLLDGSPRARSNTGLLLRALARGLEAEGQEIELRHLARPRDRAEAPELFARAECVVLGFPLYTDSMPGQVMELIERLEPRIGQPNPPIAFLVQSGFPEPGQSRAVERYLELLARRLRSRYLGTIVRGGVEGIQAQPPQMTRKLFARLERIGRTLGRTGALDARELRELAGPEWWTGLRRPLLRFFSWLGARMYWNRKLQQNGAYERRFDRPYAGGAS